MKKIGCIVFAMMLSVGMAFAESVRIGQLYYELDDEHNTAEVKMAPLEQPEYSLDTLIIPTTVEYTSKQYTVTSIGSAAFLRAQINYPEVNIPSTITRIGNNAFRSQWFTYIFIPSSVTSIGVDAFDHVRWIRYEDTSHSMDYGALAVNGYRDGDYVYTDSTCTKLQVCLVETVQTVQLPAQLKEIGDYAFWRCNLDSVIIPDSVEIIGNYAFKFCTLNFLHLPSQLRIIKEQAFSVTGQGIDSISIPRSIETIGEYAFIGCSPTKLEWNSPRLWLLSGTVKNAFLRITSLRIGDGLDSIPASFLDSLFYVEKLYVGRDVKYIEDFAMTNYTSLTSVYWNATHYTGRASRVFSKANSNITSFVFGEEVETIPEYLCYQMKKLDSIRIPESVQFIGACVVDGCKNLKAVHVPDLATYCNIEFGGDPFWYYGNSDLYVNGEKITDLVIPEGVTTLHSYAFRFPSITSVTLPASLQVAENIPFYDILNIHVPSVEFWLDLDKRGNVASYMSGTNLLVNGEIVREISIPEDRTSIGDYTFACFNSLQTVTIHRNVQTIGRWAFACCKGLRTIYNYASDPQIVNDTTFFEVNYGYNAGKCKLHVPKGSIEAYQAAGWPFYVKEEASQTTIYDDLFGTYLLDKAIIAATAYHDSLFGDYADIADTLMMAIEAAQMIVDTVTIQAVVDTAAQRLNEAIVTAHEQVAVRLSEMIVHFEAYKQTNIDILDSVKQVFNGGLYSWMFDLEESNPQESNVCYIQKIRIITYDSVMLYADNIAVVDSVMNWIQAELERIAAELEEQFQDYLTYYTGECQAQHEEGDSEACDSLIAAAVAAIENYPYDITKTQEDNEAAVEEIYEQLKIDLAAQREKDRQQGVETINEEGVLLRKTIRDGQVVIERGEQVFTVTGKEL